MSFTSLLNQAISLVSYIWTLLGYLVIFSIPLLLLSPTLRVHVLEIFNNGGQEGGKGRGREESKLESEVRGERESEGRDERERGGHPNRVSSTVPRVSSTVPSTREVDALAPTDTPTDVIDSITHEQWIAAELKRRLDNSEVLDDAFCVEVAKTLGATPDMLESAFGSEVVPGKIKEEGRGGSVGEGGEEDLIDVEDWKERRKEDREEGNPLTTDWVKDLLPDGRESAVINSLRKEHGGSIDLVDSSGGAVKWEDFSDGHVVECLDVFVNKKATEKEKIVALVKLNRINDTTEASANLGRIQRHENQVRMLNAMIANDGLSAIHNIQGEFKDKRYRQMAAHTLAKIAAKIYEGWN